MITWPNWLTPEMAFEIAVGITTVLLFVMVLALTTIIVVKVSMVLEDSSSVLPMLGFKSSKVIKLMQNVGILFRFVDFMDRIISNHKLLPQILTLGFMVPPRVMSERIEGDEFQRAEDELQNTLSALVRVVNTVPCSATGRLVWGQMLYHCALARGRVYSYLERHRSILKVPIRRPIFILGLPRTGSTLLQRLLALDTNNRAFQLWELMQPVPPPRPESYESDWRKGCLRQSQWWLNLFSNGWVRHLGEFHESNPGMFEEELVLMLGCGVAGPNHVSLGGVRTLYERRHLADHHADGHDQHKAAMYRYIRRVAQALTVYMGTANGGDVSRQLVFKSPLHSLWIGALLKEFPDAQFILLHRSPVAVVTSWVAFALANASILCSERASNKSIWARRVVDAHVRLLSVMSERLVQLQRNHADRLFECGFSDFISDPRAMVRRIYRHLNLSLTPAFEARMTAYLQQDRKRHVTKDCNRKVRLQLRDLGLTWPQVWDFFGTYYRANEKMCSDSPFEPIIDRNN